MTPVILLAIALMCGFVGIVMATGPASFSKGKTERYVGLVLMAIGAGLLIVISRFYH